jgi:hypothetical protein
LVKTFWLSLHVTYGCRHSGVCCSSGWAIGIERPRAAAVGVLRSDWSWLVPAPGAPAEFAGTIAVADTGHCVFHRDGCEIHRILGHATLPGACQHFPREVLIDARGARVTLSHYCPTAVDLLFEHAGPVEIVEGPPAIPAGDPEGLDARDVLPPLLSEGVLMDLESYSAWEAHMVRVLTEDDGRTPEDALAILETDLASVQLWRPGSLSLTDEIAQLSIGHSPVGPGGSRGPDDLVICRYLAARAFASWMAYQGGGIAAVLRSLRFVLSVLRAQPAHLPLKEAIRQTDLQVLHLMPRDAFVAATRLPRS